ncbi:hypothetical protein SISNIDRAFT_451556 [Sistotremastrum niveocremeum HHB9708]|uniref:Methyltransferase domain-containing protein n=1 Tax=Sistotremastrum niveocremeum HHB9708 TaxID=1314777 RepID=A0A164XEW1_9AGAM|nr:hypothetical protein SISNIDRAFT_451556 [Sistotremastrum niveocremeum HHB9708]
MAESDKPNWPPPLDHEYTLKEDEIAFFKQESGITDDQALKEHILKVQSDAYAIYPYPCIRRFAFATLKISRYPFYKDVLKLGKERPGAILLDIGCCFGNDSRKVIRDGFPKDQVIASDLRQGFWDLGHELFKSTPETFDVPFIAGDVFSDTLIAPAEPAYEPVTGANPPLKSLTSLNPLIHRISVIHASAFFHLFDEQQQFTIAQRLAGLLSPEPGSIIFGSHIGSAGEPSNRSNASGGISYAHSVDSWKELWDGKVFKKGSVKVDAFIHEMERKDRAPDREGKYIATLLVFCVTRL